ncbi:MAG: ABC transporter ATP-binding protein [Acidobacteriota bacterium]
MAAASGDGPAVALADVHKSFAKTVAVDGVSLEIGRGEMFGVIGPDGAGKTTLLRMVCGLLPPDRGTVRLFGADPFRMRRVATSAIGYVSQQFSLYGDLSIDENIEFFARLHGVRDFAARRTRLLSLTGLETFRDRLADRLSGGMKQKLALACTLVHEPPLLVLDEPTTGVDPVSRREFWKLLAEFLSQGLTIVLATPYLDEAERCSRVVLMSEGRALALDTPSHLQTTLAGTILEVVVAQPRRALDVLRGALAPDRVQLFGDRLHVRVDATAERQLVSDRLQQAGMAPESMRPITPSLEDVFIEQLARAADGARHGAGTAAGAMRK